MQTQQRALEIAANNVANANTPGYTRQSADMTTLGATVDPAIWSTSTGDGSGVQISSVSRFRDAFLEIQAGLQHGSLANLDQANATLQQVQNVFGEPSDNGISAQMSNFWSAWDSVANNPADNGARSVLLSSASTVASTINSVAASLQQMKNSETTQLGTLVTQINTTAASLAQVNQAIKSGSLAGLNVNTLEDQRDMLANQLAQLTGGSIQQGQNNQVTVSLNGTNLVYENHAQPLTLDTSGPTAVLRVVQGGFAVSVTSGQAGAMLNDINTVLPGFQAQLDGVATTLRDQVNNAVSPISGNVAAAARDQSASGPLTFGIALDGGATANVSIAGADWSGAGGAAALQTALQTAVDTAVGAGNATASVTANGDGSLSVAVTPVAGHALQVQASGSNAGLATLLGTTPIGADGIGGRAFFAGTGASTLALSALVAGNPSAIAAGIAANGPLDASIALEARRHVGVVERCGHCLQHDDRAARRHRQGRPDAGQRPAAVGPKSRRVAECSSRGQHRRRDDEHGRVPEGLRGLGQVHQRHQLDAHDAHQHGRTVMTMQTTRHTRRGTER